MTKRLAALFLAGALPLATPALATAPDANAELVAALADQRERDQRLLDIGWKLATANAPYCEETRPDIGLMLLDTGGFREPDAINRALGVPGRVIVQAVAPGSPAASAGLQPGMRIAMIGDWLPDEAFATDAPAWKGLIDAYTQIDGPLRSDGAIGLVFRDMDGDHRYIVIEGVPACAMRMEQRDGEDRARADGQRILIGSRFPGFGYPEDELAAAIAHEMAHIVLGHSAWLERDGRTRRNIRRTEREADRLAPWLLANAGYDPRAMERFMRRWGPDHSGGLLRKRTHDGWDERAEAIAAETALVERAMAQDGRADWKTRFVRGAAG